MVMMASAAVPPVAPMPVVTMTVVMVMMTSSAVVSGVPGAGCLDGRAQVVDHEVDVVVVGVAAAAAAATAEEGGDARLPPGRRW